MNTAMTTPRLSDNGNTAVISVKMPSDMIQIIDAVAASHLKIRSVWMREAILEKLEREDVVGRHAEFGISELIKWA